MATAEERLGEDAERVRSGAQVKESLGAAAREFLRFRSPRLILALALVAVAARLWIGGWSWWDLAVIGGVLAFWPFQEWLLHVFVLHFRPRQVGRWRLDPEIPRKHRAHHEDPWDIGLVFVPLQGVIVMAAVQLVFWPLVMPTWPLALTGIAFFFLMGLLYEWTHYLIHSRYRPRSGLYRRLWQNHRLHHCKNEHYWYGVTMTLGDRVLGTAPDHREVEQSHTCRTLEG